MKIIPNDESVVLKEGEKDIDKYFRFLEKVMPLPAEEKKEVLKLLTYVLCL